MRKQREREVQRECGFECDYFRILLANARSPSLSFGDYAWNNHKMIPV